MKTSTLAVWFVPLSISCTDQTKPSDQSDFEPNTYFNFSSDSTYHRGEDPVRRNSKNQQDQKDTSNVMGEESRSLSGGATKSPSSGEAGPDNRSGSSSSEVTQNTSRNQQETAMIENIQAEIRNNINLSQGAHNVRITSQNGQIYLRGVVQNKAEKNQVEEIAKRVAGNTLVISRIDIKDR